MPLFVNKSFNLDVTSSEDDDIICSVRDFVDSNGGVAVKKTLKLKSSLPAKEAAKEIARTCGYKEDTVSIHLEVLLGGDGDIVLEEQNEWVSLYTVCSNGSKKSNFTIHELDGKQPEKMQEEGIAETDQSTESVSRCGTLPVSTSQNLASDDYSYNPSIIKNEIGYVGLVNQAMTCYLNSLLQTLYMTPEFRNALYRWSFDGTEEDTEKSIPYQLQRLFLQLQMSNKRSVETTDLTKSFGWDSSEVWQQHDVQELCRVMFDALEQKWRNTVQANLINQLYQGKMKDYVKCLECGYESARVDAYLDIPLVIRPFGSTETYSSVTEALNAFVQPEILQESNQYFCEKCNKKCNAHKGLKFMSFPYLLTLQLKRFDFDYATMNRIKLNDKMTFPEVLDLNSFVTPVEEESANKITMEESSVLSSLTNEHVDSSDDGIDEGIEVEVTGSGTSSSSDSSSVNSDAAAKNNRNASYSGCEGPYVYELFSIMIHSGSASGGHYYAYIKSFKDGRWYSFNDQQVSKITYDDIRKTYGGSSFGRGFYSSAYTSSTSAYMLMYRRIDKTLNADFMQPENFPMSLKTELQRQKDKEEAERRQKEIDKSTCKIKVYCFHPVDQRKMDVRLEIHKDNTLHDATQMSWKLFELDKFVSLDCCRLVKYDEYQDSLEKSYEREEDKAISIVLGGVKANYTFDLLLETKRPEQTFAEYKPGGVTVKAYLVDLQSKVIHPPVNVRAYHIQTVGSFKEQLTQVFGLSNPCNLRMVLERFQNDLRLLVEPLKTLKAEGFYKSNKVFIEMREDDKDFCLPYSSSHLCQLLDRYQHTIHITCSLPSPKSVEMFLLSVERSQKKAAANSLFNHIPYSISHVSPNPSSSDGGQMDEVNSENDSAFCSGDTNSKHSLSGLDNASGFSLSSLSGTETSQLNQNTKTSSLHPDNAATTQPNMYDAITHKNDSVSCTNVQYDSMKVEAFMNFAMDEGVFAAMTDEINGEQSGSSQVSVFNSQPSTSLGSSDRKLSLSGIIPHSSSHKQLSLDLDVPDLCSKLSNVGLTSCHSDPSIYHSCLDSSLRGGPDSRRDSDSRDDTSASVELNLSSPGPDPDPILSSPENGYEFEDDDRDDNMVGVVGFVNQTDSLPLDSHHNKINLSEYSDQQSLEDLNIQSKQMAGNGDEEDWDKEINASHAESFISSDHDLKDHPPPPPPPPPLPTSSIPSTSCQSSALPSSSSANHNTTRTDNSGSLSSAVSGQEVEIDRKRYFHAVMKMFSETEDRVLDVSVDKRITLGSFKHKLQPYIGVPCSLFKVYRVYSNNQEFESFRLSDTLSFFEDGRFNIKLGRALQAGEHRVKVFQLCVNEPESCKFLIETIFAKGMSVLESKRLIAMEVQDQCGIQVSLERFRLRKKSWTNPGTVYIDNHVYDNEIPIYPNWEIFLEILDGPEELLDTSQLAVYIRQWQPSKHEIGPFKEVVLKQQTVSELKRKISALSGIPAEHVEFAKGKGTFPCEVSVLEIHTDLEWNPHVTVLNVWPLYICDDGHVVYFRDRREKLVELSDEKKKEIQLENRNSRYSQKISISPRKERALKIYTDDNTSASSKSNSKDDKNGPQQKLKIVY